MNVILYTTIQYISKHMNCVRTNEKIVRYTYNLQIDINLTGGVQPYQLK